MWDGGGGEGRGKAQASFKQNAPAPLLSQHGPHQLFRPEGSQSMRLENKI